MNKWKISNYRPPSIIQRDPKESTYKIGDDKYAPLSEEWIVEEHNRLLDELAAKDAEIERLRDVLEQVRRVASGEDQVSDDDTEGMRYIFNLVNKESE